MTINIGSAPWLSCECGNHSFKSSVFLKKLSALESPTGREEIFPIEAFSCDSCGKILPEFVKKFNLPESPSQKSILLDGQQSNTES